MTRVVIVLDVDDVKLGTVLPINAERVREQFVDDAPPGVTVVLVKVDGQTLYKVP